MTPQQIEYVLAVAEERSFSKAAKKLFVTQPSLSKFIINLETTMGVTLFDRSSSPITVTDAGKIFIETANRMKELEDEMSLKINELAGLKNGNLRIGTSPFYAANMLLKTVSSFHRKYPDIRITIQEDTYRNLEDSVLRGDIDLMIGTSSADEELFNIEVLCMEKLYLAVPLNRVVNRKCTDLMLTADDIKNNSEKLFMAETVKMDIFKKEKFIFRSNSDSSQNYLKKICRAAGFSPEIILESNNLDTIFSFVCEGLGLAFVPDTFIKFANVPVHPAYYSVSNQEAETHIKLIYKKNKYLSAPAIEFCNTLRELIGMGPWK